METNSDQLNPEQLSIATPELVDIEFPLAGIGSRFVALLIDYLIWFAMILVLSILASFLSPGSLAFARIPEQWAVAVVIFLFFLLNWGYFTLFEAFWNGQTPGKRIARIRVIQRSGRGIGVVGAGGRDVIWDVEP